MRINEFRFENDIESKIDEFGILSDKIDEEKMELSELSNHTIKGKLTSNMHLIETMRSSSAIYFDLIRGVILNN